MCLSRPGRVVRVLDGLAEVERAGRSAWFNALAVPEVRAGDWVLVHTSLVLAVVDREEAERVEALLGEFDGGPGS